MLAHKLPCFSQISIHHACFRKRCEPKIPSFPSTNSTHLPRVLSHLLSLLSQVSFHHLLASIEPLLEHLHILLAKHIVLRPMPGNTNTHQTSILRCFRAYEHEEISLHSLGSDLMFHVPGFTPSSSTQSISTSMDCFEEGLRTKRSSCSR